MAIQSRIVNNSFTEIYVGGGNSITQSAPTNFHKFYTRRILTPTENISDYKEVTASERAAIEAADAKWERPPQSFIDRWTAEVGKWGCYNEATGYFELNGLRDITYEQALRILDPMYRTLDFWDSARPWSYVEYRRMPRTTVPFICDYDHYFPSLQWTAGTEVIRFCGSSPNSQLTIKFTLDAAYNIISSTLTAILDRLVPTENVKFSWVDEAGNSRVPNLSTLYIYHTAYNVDCSLLPKLSMESVVYMVENAQNTRPITITLHPSVYALLKTSLVEAATAKQITFATTE